MTLGDRIRHARRVHGLNQSDLGRRIGVSTNAIHKMETGQTPDPRLSHVAGIAETCGVSLEYLAGLTDDPHPYSRDGHPLLAPDPLPPRSLMHRLLTSA